MLGDPGRCPWPGLLAYDVGDGVAHLAARGEHPEQLVDHDTAVGQAFTLLAARPYGQQWHPWARLRLLEPVARPQLRFSPAHDGQGVRLRFDATRFRVPSYRASQRQGPFSA